MIILLIYFNFFLHNNIVNERQSIYLSYDWYRVFFLIAKKALKSIDNQFFLRLYSVYRGLI